jgi:hypothetical protein
MQRIVGRFGDAKSVIRSHKPLVAGSNTAADTSFFGLQEPRGSFSEAPMRCTTISLTTRFVGRRAAGPCGQQPSLQSFRSPKVTTAKVPVSFLLWSWSMNRWSPRLEGYETPR